MQTFDSDGVEIAFIDEGSGPATLLIHGFASNKEVNWLHPGWVTTLTRAGRRRCVDDQAGVPQLAEHDHRE